jgi:hypothetical protein
MIIILTMSCNQKEKNGDTYMKYMKMGFLATSKDFLQNQNEILMRFVWSIGYLSKE